MDSMQSREPGAHVLYMLTFASEKRYIGQTVRPMHIRLNAHRTAAKRGGQLPVHCAWRKHGAPAVDVLGWFDTHEELHRAERAAIANLGTLCPVGYNVSVGGDTAPSKSPGVAQKIAQRATGRKIADTSAVSEASRRHWQDPEYRARVSAGLRAAMTPELREAYRARNRAMWEKRRAEGWTMPESTREKLRNKVVSEEARAKMSVAAKRRGVSPEQRERMEAGRRAARLSPKESAQ